MALQEELNDAKERNILLTARLQQRESDLAEVRSSLEVSNSDRARLRERIKEMEQLSPAITPSKRALPECGGGASTNAETEEPLRVAELKKIRKVDGTKISGQVTGSDLSSMGVRQPLLTLLVGGVCYCLLLQISGA